MAMMLHFLRYMTCVWNGEGVLLLFNVIGLVWTDEGVCWGPSVTWQRRPLTKVSWGKWSTHSSRKSHTYERILSLSLSLHNYTTFLTSLVKKRTVLWLVACLTGCTVLVIRPATTSLHQFHVHGVPRLYTTPPPTSQVHCSRYWTKSASPDFYITNSSLDHIYDLLTCKSYDKTDKNVVFVCSG